MRHLLIHLLGLLPALCLVLPVQALTPYDLETAEPPVRISWYSSERFEHVSTRLALPGDPSPAEGSTSWLHWFAPTSGVYSMQGQNPDMTLSVYEEEPGYVPTEGLPVHCWMFYWPGNVPAYSDEDACVPRVWFNGMHYRRVATRSLPGLRSGPELPGGRIDFEATEGLAYLLSHSTWDWRAPRIQLVEVFPGRDFSAAPPLTEEVSAQGLPSRLLFTLPTDAQAAREAVWTAATTGTVEITMVATEPCAVDVLDEQGLGVARLDNRPRRLEDAWLPGNHWDRLAVSSGDRLRFHASGLTNRQGRVLVWLRAAPPVAPEAEGDQALPLVGAAPVVDCAFDGAGYRGQPNAPVWYTWTAPTSGVALFRVEDTQSVSRVRVHSPGSDHPLADSFLLSAGPWGSGFPGINRAAVPVVEGQTVRVEVLALREGAHQARLSVRYLSVPRLHSLRVRSALGFMFSPGLGNFITAPRAEAAFEAALDPDWFYIRETSADLVHWVPQRNSPLGTIGLVPIGTNPIVPTVVIDPPLLALRPDPSGRLSNTNSAYHAGGDAPAPLFIRYRVFLDGGGPRTLNFPEPMQPQ